MQQCGGLVFQRSTHSEHVMRNKSQRSILSIVVLSLIFSISALRQAVADPVPPELQAKIDTYKKKLTEWAANPIFITAVKDSNAKGGLVPGMNNAKWDDLAEKDPVVLGFQSNEAGKAVSQLDQDKGISKLYLRDEKGNLVACSNSKPLLYNNGSKPWVANPLKEGKPWSAAEVKPDPATQIKGVHLAVPVLDGGKTIGVLHTSVIAE
ncbi:MAG: hypothetical protein HY273_14145 [Gammaproteobacteria bacterium]|nr:hypothetical protein [Gammaproteobacteria bacterium]